MPQLSRRDVLRGSVALAAYTLASRPLAAVGLQPAADEQLIPWLDGQPKGRGIQWQDLTTWVTANENLYEVSHYPKPKVDLAKWHLEVTGLVKHSRIFTLADLQKRRRKSIYATLECGGNGAGIGFMGAIGNIQWTGTPLAPLLRECGMVKRSKEAVFYGADEKTEKIRDQDFNQNFARSLDLNHALADEVLLAWEMNGKPLDDTHGAPLRLVVPGWFGVAWVKWLTRIDVIDRRFMGKWMAREYVTIRGEERPEGATNWRETSVCNINVKSIAARAVRRPDGSIRISGAAWSDGTPLTAKDVAYTFNLGKRNDSLQVNSFLSFASIVATDDKTVTVTIDQKAKNVSEVLRQLCEQYVFPQHVFEKIADDKLMTAQMDTPIGSGPFPLSKADQTQIVMKRNDSYWGKTFYGGMPAFSQIIHPIFKSNEDSNLKLQSGEIDVAQSFIPQLWKMWEGGKPIGTFLKDKPYFVPGSMPMLLMNTTKKGLDNAAVRKAIASAIDYASIAETAMSGYSGEVKASLILPSGAEGKFFNEADATANGWKFDAAAAEKILTDAGATKGSDGIYTIGGNRLGPYKLITPTGWTDWNAACEIVAKNLKAIGIDCATNFPQQAETTQAIQGGTFDLACWYVAGVNASSPWARFRDIMSQSEGKPVGKTTFANYGRWKNAEVEGFLTEAAQAVDDGAKKAAYDKLDALYRKEVPSCPLMYRPDEFYIYNASNFFNWPDENNAYAPPMLRGAGNTWLFKLQKIAG